MSQANLQPVLRYIAKVVAGLVGVSLVMYYVLSLLDTPWLRVATVVALLFAVAVAWWKFGRATMMSMALGSLLGWLLSR